MAEIGSTLREARMRARIDISEVEAHTKIRAKYLRAIENEEWDLLPGTIYVRSFLKTYGDYLGLDSRILIDEFKRRYENPSEQERPLASIARDRVERTGSGNASSQRGGGRNSRGPRRPVPQQRRRLRFGPEAGLVVVIVVIVVALILIHNHHASNGPGAGAAVTPSNTGHKHIHKHKAKGKTVTKTATKTTPTVTTKAKVALAATTADGVWVCVEGPNNKVLVRGQVYTDGEKIPTATGAKLLVSLGNTDVKATVNGKSYPIVSSTSANGLVAFEATPTGTHALTTGPTCGE